jgi:hypothetical protein
MIPDKAIPANQSRRDIPADSCCTMLPEKFPALSYCDAIISPCGNALPPSSAGFVFIG